jgi:HK97 family phage prohead protease
MGTIERRFSGVALRALNPIENASNSPGTVTGYSAKYSYAPGQNLSENLGGFRERLQKGCFDRSLANNMDMRCDFNHDNNYPLGRTGNSSLSLSSDSTGLLMRCVLPNTSYARDLMENIRSGNISSQSFAFECEDDDWGDCDDPDNPGTRTKLRTVRRAKLHGVSIVTKPAYNNSSVEVDPVVAALGRSHSFEAMFPQGLPQEVRSRIGVDAARRFEETRERRRRMGNLILSL